jgi:ApeA N-terminal domain 1
MPTFLTQRALEAGESLLGSFWPAGSEFATPGVLSWSTERGAELELADLTDPWPTDFASQFDVQGQLRDGETITMLRARVKSRTFDDKTFKLQAAALGLGAHCETDTRWQVSHYRPASLHEWLPVSGLSPPAFSPDRARLVLEWNAPPTHSAEISGGTLRLRPGADWAWSYAPSLSIDTSLTFSIEADEEMTIEDHWSQFCNPLLSFCVFAVDRPDDLIYESYFSRTRNEGVTVMRSGREGKLHDWNPTDGHYLFQAKEVEDPAAVIAAWVEAWHRTEPALGLLAEVINAGNTFTVPRFITLYTAAERYWKATHPGKQWSPAQLPKTAGIDRALTGSSKEAVSLIGASRNYHAHLEVGSRFTPERIVGETYESTRRLHALLQACLLRDLGFDVVNTERLLGQHYRHWPVP